MPEDELLERRLSQVDAELDRTSHEPQAAVEDDERAALTHERQVLEATLTALRHLSQIASASDSTVEPPVVEVDELEQALSGARQAINAEKGAMSLLPPIARESLFQYFHAGQPLTVGGTLDRCSVEDAIRAEENGYVNWVEDEEQTVSARYEHPRVDAAVTALQRLRANVFSGVSWDARASAPPWAQAFLRTEHDIDDPEFGLRPVWVRLGFLDEE